MANHLSHPLLFSKPRVRSTSFSTQNRPASFSSQTSSQRDEEIFTSESCDPIISFQDARTRRYYARQNSTGCFDSALYPESKINYYPTSGHDDSGFMDRESNTPITYVANQPQHIRFNEGMSGDHHPPPPHHSNSQQMYPFPAHPYPAHLTNAPMKSFNVDKFIVKFQQTHTMFNNLDQRGPFPLPFTHKIVNPEGIEAARAWFKEYSLYEYYNEMLKLERELHRPDIFHIQTAVTMADRAKLLGWIIRVCCSNVFECMHQEALHLCVSIIDTFLSHSSNIPKTEFQLVGITALLIASKQLLYDPPEIRQLLRLCEDIYLPQDVKKYERMILKCMNWRLHRPTTHTFADFFAARLLYKANWRPDEALIIVRHLSVVRYCLDYGLMSTPFCAFYPSARAKAAYHLAALMLNEKSLVAEFDDHVSIVECMDTLREVMVNESQQQLNIHENIFINYSYS